MDQGGRTVSFRIHLFLASVRLASRALRVWLAASALRLSAAALGLSKRIGPPPPPSTDLSTLKHQPSCAPLSAPPMTVDELLSMAERLPSRHFVLRLHGALIEITQVDEVLETAVFHAPSEGHPWPRGQSPFFLSCRSEHDKPALK